MCGHLEKWDRIRETLWTSRGFCREKRMIPPSSHPIIRKKKKQTLTNRHTNTQNGADRAGPPARKPSIFPAPWGSASPLCPLPFVNDQLPVQLDSLAIAYVAPDNIILGQGFTDCIAEN